MGNDGGKLVDGTISLRDGLALQKVERGKGKMRDTIAKMEAFLGDYATFKEPEVKLPLVLWTICTQAIEIFDTFPYLVITSSTKRSGKTRASELLGFLSCNCQSPNVRIVQTVAIASAQRPTLSAIVCPGIISA